MKKFLVSAAFALLIMFSAAPMAHADAVYYPSPGDITAGSPLDYLIATLPSGNTVAAGGAMPEGIALCPEDNGENINVYFRGTALKAGTYTCMLTVNDRIELICTLRVIPAKPVLSLPGEIHCRPGETAVIELSASVPDAGVLSYQWYKTDSSGTSILEGEAGPSCVPDTSAAGESSYFCEVTNTNNGKSATVKSPSCMVFVGEPELSSVSVISKPALLSYGTGETISTDGLKICLNYSDGSSEIISDGFSTAPSSFDTPGEHTVEVSYMGKTCSFTVTVSEAEESIERITVLTMPWKTEYLTGEEINADGLSLRVYTAGGHRDVIKGFECSPCSFDSAGTHKVIVSYGGLSCTYEVNVTEPQEASSIKILTPPEKLSYHVGEKFSSEGLSLEYIQGDETSVIKEGFKCSPGKFKKAGAQVITVSYEGLSCTFTVNVAEQPEKESPEPEPEIPEEAPEEEKGSSHVLTAVLCTAAVLCAGAFVFAGIRSGKFGRHGGKK